jgi:hypothetical protein
MEGRDDAEDPEGMRIRPSERLAQTFHYVVSELLENAVTHAQAHGFVGARVCGRGDPARARGVVVLHTTFHLNFTFR